MRLERTFKSLFLLALITTSNEVEKPPARRFYVLHPEILPHATAALGMVVPPLYKPLVSSIGSSLGHLGHLSYEEEEDDHEEEAPNLQLVVVKNKNKRQKSHRPRPLKKVKKFFKKCLPFKFRIFKRSSVDRSMREAVLLSLNTSGIAAAAGLPKVLHLWYPRRPTSAKSWTKTKPWTKARWAVAPPGRPVRVFPMKEPPPHAAGGSPPGPNFRRRTIPIRDIVKNDKEAVGKVSSTLKPWMVGNGQKATSKMEKSQVGSEKNRPEVSSSASWTSTKPSSWTPHQSATRVSFGAKAEENTLEKTQENQVTVSMAKDQAPKANFSWIPIGQIHRPKKKHTNSITTVSSEDSTEKIITVTPENNWKPIFPTNLPSRQQPLRKLDVVKKEGKHGKTSSRYRVKNLVSSGVKNNSSGKVKRFAFEPAENNL